MIVGTAGHIDHGKTSLVRRLTGRNTDRLPEEIAVRFRAARPAVVGRIADGRFLLDLRGVFEPDTLLVELD